MKSFLNFLVNTVIFLLISVGSFLVAWRFIQEDVILFFTQVPITSEDFEVNLIEAEETAEFDWGAVAELDANYWLEYIDVGDQVSPIGELIMPSIETRVPIFLGVGEPNITIGAGTMSPEMEMGQGNYVLGSHWDPNPGIRFGGLYRIQVGDTLILRDADYLYIYETIIGDNYIIEAYRSDIVDYVEGEILLTLFTCTPGGERRVMVRGELVDQLSIDELREISAAQAEADAAAALAELAELPRMDVEVIIDVVETLEETEVPFPIVLPLAIGGSLLLGILVVRFSNRGSRRARR